MRTVRLAASAAVAACALFVAPQAASAATDYAATALNIVAGGQLESGEDAAPYIQGVQTPFSRQAEMYNGLTPLFRNVTDADLAPDKYFKAESLEPTTVATTENPPGRPGLTIKRTDYGVPHVYGATDDDVTWGAGWVAAEDRSLLLKQARYVGLTASINMPGVSAINLLSSLSNFKPSKQTLQITNRQTAVLAKQGPRGKQLLHDIDVYVEGINAWFAINDPSTPKFTRTDIYAANAIKGQYLGQGGGEEIANSNILDALTQKFGASKGRAMWNDLRERNDPDSAVTDSEKSFPWQSQSSSFKGNVVLRNGSFQSASPLDTPQALQVISTARSLKRSLTVTPQQREHQASNVLLVSGQKTGTGHPLMVAGPQISFFNPGLTYEIGLHGPHRNTVGVTSVNFPGYMLIGRGQDFAWTLTSAASDIVDQFAETLCDGSKTKYLYKGKCIKMGTVNAGSLVLKGKSIPATFRTTVHGSVTGYARTRDGNKLVALAEKRSDYGEETVDDLYNQSLTDGSVKSYADYKKAASLTPQTFNSFYMDDKHIGFYTAGLLPMRAKNSTGDLPIDGRGKYEWTGFLKTSGHPQAVDPKSGMIVNWNNKPAKDFPASDSRWDEAPIQRQQMLVNELARTATPTPASVTGAMNAAATQDVRSAIFWPTLKAMLAKGKAPSARDQKMADLMQQWYDQGSSRLAGDDQAGNITAPGAAIWDAAFPAMAGSAMCERLTSKVCKALTQEQIVFQAPPGGQYGGWHQYMQKDFKTELGQKVKAKYSTRYCGLGDVKKCAAEMWSALDAAGNTLQAKQGADPAAWRKSAVPELITFSPLPLITMRYTNRPTGIQQIVSFSGHR